jgi:hypothetical protein
VYVLPTDRVATVLEKVCAPELFAAGVRPVLLFAGKPLLANKKLSDYAISEQNTLHWSSSTWETRGAHSKASRSPPSTFKSKQPATPRRPASPGFKKLRL